MSPTFTGIHHLKFPVTDPEASADWFHRAFGTDRIEKFDHHDENGKLYAVMLQFPGISAPVELRLAPDAATAVAGYDPVTFGVADEKALDAWVQHLDHASVGHSDKVSGFIGQVISVTTPDGLDIRLYTDPVGGFDKVQMDPGKADIHNPQLSTAKMSSGPQGAS